MNAKPMDIKNPAGMKGVASLGDLQAFCSDTPAGTGRPFLIFGLPRSMTAWLSCFLTCGKVFCQHELTSKLASATEIADSIRTQPFAFSGLADPGALMIWRELTELLPDATLIYVRRDSAESQRSLSVAAEVDGWKLDKRYDLLNQRASDFIHYAKPKVLEFHDLAEAHWLQILWHWCAGQTPIPEAHLRKMMSLRVTQKDEIIQQAARSPQQGVCVW